MKIATHRSTALFISLFVLFAAVIPVLAAPPIFEDFNSQPNPVPVEFISVPGAALSSSQGAGDWITADTLPGLYALLDGVVVPQRRCDSVLQIALDDYYEMIQFNFAYGSSTSNITVSLWNGVPGAGGFNVGSQTFFGSQMGGSANWYEGTGLVKNGTPFNYVLISNRDGCAALDNLNIE